jgi:hypothetical protein
MEMRVFLILVVLLAPRLALSGEAAEAPPEVELEEGYRLVLDGENLSLLLQGKPIWNKALEHGALGEERTLVKHRLAGGLVAVHVKVARADGRHAELVLVKKDGSSNIEVVWNETTGLRGDPGERVGRAVRFHDLTGDDLPEIVVGEVSEMVRLCGQAELPLLFRQVFDPQKGIFRSVLAKRPGLKAPVNLKGRFQTESAKKPLIEHLAPSGASRSAGDGNQALLLALPREAVDRNPKTAWTPFPSNGAGEFASFRLSADAYGVTRVGIRPLPEASTKGQWDRPRTLLLSTDKSVFRLTFPEDPEQQPEASVWFDLPKPEKSTCLSLVVETSYQASPKRLLPVAELMVETEVDGPGGLARLASDLKDPGKRRQAANLLKQVGEGMVPAIRKVWPRLDVQGKRLATDALADAAPEESIDLLTLVALEEDRLAVQLALKGLDRAPEAAVTALSEYLDTAEVTKFERAVRVLAVLNTDKALDALVLAVGKGERKKRAFLREQLAVAASRTDARLEALWSRVTEAETAGMRERLFDLLRVADDFERLKDRVVPLASTLFDSSKSFADRYRALESLGSAGCDATMDRLLAGAGDDDRHIRVVSLFGLYPCAASDARALAALQKALADRAPLVRLTALKAFSKPKLASKALGKATHLAQSDPWPIVRASTVSVAKHLAPQKALPILEVAVQDDSPMVREAAVESAVHLPGKSFDQLIESRLSAEDETPKIRERASLAAGKRCQKSALPLLFEVLRKGAEPMAAQEDIRAAVAAASSMGHIGGPEARALLEKAKRRSNLHTDKAIKAALKNPGDTCAKKR